MEFAGVDELLAFALRSHPDDHPRFVRFAPPTGRGTEDRDLLILECDYRGPSGCGCRDRDWCGLRKGTLRGRPTEVTYADCRKCVSGA